MPGTKAGGLKARATLIEKYGKDYYSKMGKIGGMRGHTGGFASNLALACVAGRKGGAISKRKGERINLDLYYNSIKDKYLGGESVKQLAREYGVSDGAMKRFLNQKKLLLPEYTNV